MKKFVKIQSNINIVVTCGTYYQDETNVDSRLENRLKINAQWPKATILIEMGQHFYPGMIGEWNTVKALEKDGVLSVVGYFDECDEQEAYKKAEDLEIAMDEVKKNTKVREENKPKKIIKQTKVTEVDLDKMTDEE